MRTIGFYSFKGGVGRTNLVMNFAYYLAKTRNMVGLLDLDLEAPGLTVAPSLRAAKNEPYPDKGLSDFLRAFANRSEDDKNKDVSDTSSNNDDEVKDKNELPDIKDLYYRTKMLEDWNSGAVYLWPAVSRQEYDQNSKRIPGFRTGSLYHAMVQKKGNIGIVGEWVFKEIKKQIENCKLPIPPFRSKEGEYPNEGNLDYLLIDLRTGMTFLSDLALGILFDEMVIVSGLNQQNIIGLEKTLELIKQKLTKKDIDQIPVLPVFSPIPNGEIRTVDIKLRKLYERLEIMAASLEGSPLGLDLSCPPRIGDHLLPYTIHYCDYLAIAEDVLLEEFPTTLAAQDILDICKYIAADPQDRMKKINKKLRALFPRYSPDSDTAETMESKNKKILPEHEVWNWAFDFFRASSDWRWPLKEFAKETDENQKWLDKFTIPFEKKDFAREINSSVASSISLGLEEKKKIMQSWEKLSNKQVMELARIFDEERRKFSALSPKHARQTGFIIIQMAYDWILFFKESGIRLISDIEMVKYIDAGKASHPAIPRPFMLLAFAKHSKLEKAAIAAMKCLLKDLSTPVDVIYDALVNLDIARPSVKKAIVSDLELWINHVLQGKHSMTWLIRLTYPIAEKFELPNLAEKIASKAIELYPESPSPQYNLGTIFQDHLKLYDKSEEAFRKAIELDPSHSYSWNGLGSLLSNKPDRYEESEAAYLKAIELEPKSAYPWHNLGNLYQYETRRYKKAEENYRKAIELDPKFASSWNSLGNLLRDHFDRYEESEEAYRKAIELNPKSAYFRTSFGYLQQYIYGRYDEAELAYKKALEIDPCHQVSLNSYGILLMDNLDRDEEARELFEKAIQQKGSRAGYAFYNCLRLITIHTGSKRKKQEFLGRMDSWLKSEEELDFINNLDDVHGFAYGITGNIAMVKKIISNLSNRRLTNEDKIWLWILKAFTKKMPDEPIDSISKLSKFKAYEIEGIIHLVATVKKYISKEAFSEVKDWISKALKEFVPPEGTRDIEYTRLIPYLKLLGISKDGSDAANSGGSRP